MHLSRSAASWKVTVLCADDDLVRTSRDSRPRIDARSAAGLDDLRSGITEDVSYAISRTGDVVRQMLVEGPDSGTLHFGAFASSTIIWS